MIPLIFIFVRPYYPFNHVVFKAHAPCFCHSVLHWKSLIAQFLHASLTWTTSAILL